MSFDEKIATLIQRLPNLVDHLHTEEATKNALVMPFIAALGYDVFNPKEVIPEFVADVGTKKGEKVDYAIKHDDEVILLIECKGEGTDLTKVQMSQLYRYFSVTKARIAVLTNGIQYQFYSDLEKPNIMDNRPFLELDLKAPRKSLLKEVKKLAKEEWNLDQMLSTANELKYTSEIKKVLKAQHEQPSDEFVKFFFYQVNPGARYTSVAKEEFRPMVVKAFAEFISEKVSDRLESALESETRLTVEAAGTVQEPEAKPQEPEEPDNGIVTTEEELEGYRIVCAIGCRAIPVERIVHRDTKSYMGILLDDNNRKPICRLRFNARQKYLGVIDKNKNEKRIPIDNVIDIYRHSENILATIKGYGS